TSLVLMLMEISFRKHINYIQYGLIALALALFYLLLLAMAEKMPFGLAYAIASVMTTGLIGMFAKGLMLSIKAMTLITAALVAEFVIMFILIQLGSVALLVSSLLLFVLLAVTMYFTLKLKVENKEIYLKL
ncbi:MAG: cell envelope integrity protein CreD, partial [Muribaculaceae bacterium]|nr:cell envelope integrity protein CreD [Muribaculaceae bacterium]